MSSHSTPTVFVLRGVAYLGPFVLVWALLTGPEARPFAPGWDGLDLLGAVWAWAGLAAFALHREAVLSRRGTGPAHHPFDESDLR